MGRTPAQDKWDAANMASQTVRVRKSLLDDFKEACVARGDKVNTVLRKAIEAYISEQTEPPKSLMKKRRQRTEEQRIAYNAYQREYRRRNPARVKRWHDDYIVRKAESLMKTKEG